MAASDSDDVALQVELGAADAARLARAFGITADNTDALRSVAQAALDEYAAYFTGSRPSTVSGGRELRLALLLARQAPNVANERRIASLFALTTSQARSLLAGARARYAAELEAPMRAALEEALKGRNRSGKLDADQVWFRAPASLVAVMRDVVGAADAAYAPIRSDVASTGTWVTGAPTLRYVCESLGIDPAGIEALS